jgi:hypothetical protein
MTHDLETERGKAFCTELMDIDDSFGIKASFQVVPGGRKYRRGFRPFAPSVLEEDIAEYFQLDGVRSPFVEESTARVAGFSC